MSWKKLSAARSVAAEPTSIAELDDLRRKVASNLKDAKVAGLSAQGRYEFAYNAARIMATMVVRASGYRVTSKAGHHWVTFQALAAAGQEFARPVAVFDVARMKRNDFSYDEPTEVSETDAADLVGEVEAFVKQAEAWIARQHPALAQKDSR